MALALLAALLLLPRQVAASTQLQKKVYWTDENNGQIHRANAADGSESEVVVGGRDKPTGLVVDAQLCSMYWMEKSSQSIKKAHLDGSNVQEFIALSSTRAGDNMWISDPGTGSSMLYWSTLSPKNIYRTSLDGGGDSVESMTWGSRFFDGPLAVESPPGGPAKIFGVDYDSIYIQEWGSTTNSAWNNVDDGMYAEATSLAVDPIAGDIYWTDAFETAVMRSNINAQSFENVAGGVDRATAMDLDVGDRTLFVVTLSGQKIQQIDFDGTLGWTLSPPGQKVSSLRVVDMDLAIRSDCFVTASSTSTVSTLTNTTTTTSTTSETSTTQSFSTATRTTTTTSTNTDTTTTTTATGTTATSTTTTASTVTTTGTTSTETSTTTGTMTSTTGTITETTGTVTTTTSTVTGTTATITTTTTASATTTTDTDTTTSLTTTLSTATSTSTRSSRTQTHTSTTTTTSTGTTETTRTTTTTTTSSTETTLTNTSTSSTTVTSSTTTFSMTTSSSTTTASSSTSGTTTTKSTKTSTLTSTRTSTFTATSRTATTTTTRASIPLTTFTATTTVTTTTLSLAADESLVVDGSLALSVSDPTQFMVEFENNPVVKEELARGIAEHLHKVSVDMVHITGASFSRRLSGRARRLAGVVDVAYRIIAPKSYESELRLTPEPLPDSIASLQDALTIALAATGISVEDIEVEELVFAATTTTAAAAATSSAGPSPTPTPTKIDTAEESSSAASGILIAVGIAAVLVVFCLCAGLWACSRRGRAQSEQEQGRQGGGQNLEEAKHSVGGVGSENQAPSQPPQAETSAVVLDILEPSQGAKPQRGASSSIPGLLPNGDPRFEAL